MTTESEIENLKPVSYRKAADILGVSASTVMRLVREGHLATEDPLPGLRRRVLRYGTVVEYLRRKNPNL